MIPNGAKVLDLGCGDGDLLAFLHSCREVKARGVEIGEAGVLACVRRGLSVRQGNLQEGLADYPDNSFDFVVLSQTLPFLDDPAMILREILRVGKAAIVSLPNWGYWQCRLSLLFRGTYPQSDGPAPALVRDASLAGVHGYRLCTILPGNRHKHCSADLSG